MAHRLEIWAGKKGETAYLNHKEKTVAWVHKRGKQFRTVTEARRYLKRAGYTYIDG